LKQRRSNVIKECKKGKDGLQVGTTCNLLNGMADGGLRMASVGKHIEDYRNYEEK
jgi:hypothetical protein